MATHTTYLIPESEEGILIPEYKALVNKVSECCLTQFNDATGHDGADKPTEEHGIAMENVQKEVTKLGFFETSDVFVKKGTLTDVQKSLQDNNPHDAYILVQPEQSKEIFICVQGTLATLSQEGFDSDEALLSIACQCNSQYQHFFAEQETEKDQNETEKERMEKFTTHLKTEIEKEAPTSTPIKVDNVAVTSYPVPEKVAAPFVVVPVTRQLCGGSQQSAIVVTFVKKAESA